MRRILASTVLALAMLAASCGSPEPDPTSSSQAPLGPAAWPSSITLALVGEEEEVADDVTSKVLAAELGIEIETYRVTDRSAVIEAVLAGRVDLAEIGAFSYVLAEKLDADIDLLATWGRGPGEPGSYRSYLLTAPDSAIDTLADVAGHTICFADPTSTSGQLIPAAALLELGLDPLADDPPFEVIYAGGHDASVLSVANGACDAGFAYDGMAGRLVDAGDLTGVADEVEPDQSINPDEAQLRVVWKSSPIPPAAIVIQRSLPEDLRQEIQRVLTTSVNRDAAEAEGYCEPEVCDTAYSQFWGMTEAHEEQFDPIRKLCDLTDAPQCQGEE